MLRLAAVIDYPLQIEEVNAVGQQEASKEFFRGFDEETIIPSRKLIPIKSL